MPMRPIAKWRGRENDRRAVALDCPGFPRLVLARLGLPRPGGATLRFCGPDRCMSGLVPLPPLKVQARDGTGTPGDFDYYVLSLSWSSGFCETPAGERARGQCDAGANLGFVVHGLWPQYEHGYPSDCGPAARFPSRMALDSAQGLYPSEGLAGMNGRSTAPARAKAQPTISPTCGARASPSSFQRPLPPPKKNRPGRRSILRAPSSPQIRGCGQAC